jgi:diacylglycerol kinase (ATP)
MKRHIFFINPRARDGKLARMWEAVSYHFEGELTRTEFVLPTSARQCREQAAEEASIDDTVLVAVGGEGTMNAVANGIVDAAREAHTPMALVPFGNVNDYATTIGMRKNWREALDVLKRGHVVPVGMTELYTQKGSYFSVNLADTGFGAATAKLHSVDRRLSWVKGQLKYNLLALIMLAKWRNVPCRVEIDDEVLSGNLSILLAGFSPTLGAFKLVPHARPDADRMAVAIAMDLGKLEMMQLIQKARTQPLPESERVLFRKAKRIVVDAEGPLVCEVDGEIVDLAAYRIEFISHPGRLRFVVPPTRLD